ncbi:MAG TPA: hypothetical protein VMG10_04550 [Gemmataceae bacterium]|nr:hypothetical protein [Gemmataceae bacterium]
MRKFMFVAAVTLGLAAAGAVHAQSSSGSSSSGSSSGTSVIRNIFKFPKSLNINVTPNIVNNSAMDYRNQNAPIGGYTVQPNTTGTAFPYTLSSMFYTPSRTNFISNTQTLGQSVFPTPAQMQAAAPAYLSAFQMYRAAPIQP